MRSKWERDTENLYAAFIEQLFREHWPTSATVYLPGGKVPETGTLFTNKALAATYSRILKEAESAGGSREIEIEKARKTWSRGTSLLAPICTGAPT